MDSTKDDGAADNGGDLLTAYQMLQKEAEPTKAETKEPETVKDEESDVDDGKEGEALVLDDLKDGDDIAAWKEQKEKGVKKLVERNKARQAELEAKIKEAEEGRAAAKVYLDNKDDIDGALAWLHKASRPETMEEAIAELRAKVKGGEFVPEHDSEKALASHLDAKYRAEIAALKAELLGITAPLVSEKKAREQADALERRAQDTYEEAALEIAATCNGYQLDKEDYRKAVKANPTLEGAEAVRKHLFSEILAHTATVASGQRPKKREMLDSATKKDAVPPASSDMVEHYRYMRESGLIKDG